MSPKSDASTKILGFKYQEMVALKECFEAKDGTKIYLECLGDVSDGKTSTEVKHSVNGEKKLIDTHIDFWKTLSNIITEYDTYRFYNKFILHTTAEVKKDSIFEKWNDLNKSDKQKKIIAVKSNETIKAYYNNVKAFDKNNLENLLDKFEIKENQKSAKEYYQDLLIGHTVVINNIEPKNREEFICSMFGYVSLQLVNAIDYIWEIDIEAFRENFRSYAKKYLIEDLNFPISNASADDSAKDNFHFVKNLENIQYERKIGSSMANYLKASESQIKMIEARNSLCENLDNFDDDIKDVILELKDSHLDQLTKDCDTNEKSRRFFDDSINKISSQTKIEGITNIRPYYPKGRLLHNVEIKTIDINLKSEDESK
ncbi:hypothetical protein LZ575_01130 [Antarcticibacterium sp. 1MA-6-2]|uniref:hypothetical protein n=1 Tax=Antarcticibacterium sp. 1MA-6-2 TaxID=2908210 RepID=UPI001F3CDE7D|nr:hypothetical protein [Antarcticibacterium sp. 1MA-6-2]UJH91420.1 hypothetical protein LZ575_01130 [Antarcticibacterium sp. 1MA-6-2]